MSKKTVRFDPFVCGLERPKFGHFIRQVAPVSNREIAECLTEQEEKGCRLGEILARRGIIAESQISEVLALQARWIAASMHAELAPLQLPYPTFLSVCMPAFNEELNIRSTIESACTILPHFVERFEIVIVNDGSRDNTAGVVATLAEKNDRVRLIAHEVNRGYGAAVSTGLKAAHGDLVMFTDSDGQFSMLDLPQLLGQIDRHDVVLGYRHRRAETGMRRLNAWNWSQLVRAFLGVRVRDLDCAFKLFHREVIDQLEMTTTGACINAEILAQCIHGKLRMCEVPVNHYARCFGAPTGAAVKVIMRAFRELPGLKHYRTNPRLLVNLLKGSQHRPVPHVNGKAARTPLRVNDG
jgi:hypothetical protein